MSAAQPRAPLGVRKRQERCEGPPGKAHASLKALPCLTWMDWSKKNKRTPQFYAPILWVSWDHWHQKSQCFSEIIGPTGVPKTITNGWKTIHELTFEPQLKPHTHYHILWHGRVLGHVKLSSLKERNASRKSPENLQLRPLGPLPLRCRILQTRNWGMRLVPTPLRPVVTQFSTASNSKRSTSPCAEKKGARGAEKLHEEICWRFCDPNRPKLPFHIPFILVQTCPNILSNDSPRYHQKSTSIQQNQVPTSSVKFFWSSDAKSRKSSRKFLMAGVVVQLPAA